MAAIVCAVDENASFRVSRRSSHPLLARTSGCMDRLVKGAIRIKLNADTKQRERVQTQYSMESKHQIIKTLQYTYITKIPRRHREKHAKKMKTK
jgi:hypothetical protein